MKDESQYVLEPADDTGVYAMVPLAVLVSSSKAPSTGDKRKREELETRLEEADSFIQADMEWTGNVLKLMRKSSVRHNASHVDSYKIIAERFKMCYDLACGQAELMEKILKCDPPA
jgi:hypothetical protein